MPFPSDEWLAALADAASTIDPALLAGVDLVIEQEVEGHGSWQVVIADGHVSVRRDGPADVRFQVALDVADSIRAGERSALDAFLAGDLRLGGDTRLLLAHHKALATVGDLLAIP